MFPVPAGTLEGCSWQSKVGTCESSGPLVFGIVLWSTNAMGGYASQRMRGRMRWFGPHLEFENSRRRWYWIELSWAKMATETRNTMCSVPVLFYPTTHIHSNIWMSQYEAKDNNSPGSLQEPRTPWRNIGRAKLKRLAKYHQILWKSADHLGVWESPPINNHIVNNKSSSSSSKIWDV